MFEGINKRYGMTCEALFTDKGGESNKQQARFARLYAGLHLRLALSCLAWRVPALCARFINSTKGIVVLPPLSTTHPTTTIHLLSLPPTASHTTYHLQTLTHHDISIYRLHQTYYCSCHTQSREQLLVHAHTQSSSRTLSVLEDCRAALWRTPRWSREQIPLAA